MLAGSSVKSRAAGSAGYRGSRRRRDASFLRAPARYDIAVVTGLRERELARTGVGSMADVILAGDIGGTKTHLGLFRAGGAELEQSEMGLGLFRAAGAELVPIRD